MHDEEDEDHMGILERMIPSVKVHRQHHGSFVDPDDEHDDRPYQSFQERRRKMNKKKRIVRKGGLTNVTYKNISKKRRRYISDLYTTLLDSSWTYVVLLFASSFFGSWIMFGVIYYVICFTHGDFS